MIYVYYIYLNEVVTTIATAGPISTVAGPISTVASTKPDSRTGKMYKKK